MRLKKHLLGYQTMDGKFLVYRLDMDENGKAYSRDEAHWYWRSMDGNERSHTFDSYKKYCIVDLALYLKIGPEEYLKLWNWKPQEAVAA